MRAGQNEWRRACTFEMESRCRFLRNRILLCEKFQWLLVRRSNQRIVPDRWDGWDGVMA